MGLVGLVGAGGLRVVRIRGHVCMVWAHPTDRYCDLRLCTGMSLRSLSSSSSSSSSPSSSHGKLSSLRFGFVFRFRAASSYAFAALISPCLSPLKYPSPRRFPDSRILANHFLSPLCQLTPLVVGLVSWCQVDESVRVGGLVGFGGVWFGGVWWFGGGTHRIVIVGVCYVLLRPEQYRYCDLRHLDRS